MSKQKILFVCVENSCRSQMAEGFARHYGQGILEVFSAGSKPSGEVSPMAIKVMRESGIDISHQRSKGFIELPVKKFDYVISLGCQDVCPLVPANKHIEWNIEDPQGGKIDFFRKVRDQIENKIMDLIKEMSARERKRG